MANELLKATDFISQDEADALDRLKSTLYNQLEVVEITISGEYISLGGIGDDHSLFYGNGDTLYAAIQDYWRQCKSKKIGPASAA